MKMLTDTGAAFGREMVPELRAPIALLPNLLLPLLFLLLFGPLLATTPAGGSGSSWQWFLPGILVLLALSETGAGAGLQNEITSGSFERMLVTPVSRVALLVGRSLKQTVTLTAQGVLLIAVLLPTEFRLYPLTAAVGLLLLAIFGLGLSSLSFAVAVVAKKSQTVFFAVQQLLFFPLLLLSGVLLPMDLAPRWLYTASRFNPVAYVVEAERDLFAGTLASSAVAFGVIAAGATALLGLVLGVRVMRRAAA